MDPEVLEILQRLQEPLPEVAWQVGDRLMATWRPFKGMSGVVACVDKDHERLTAATKIVGRETPIQLSFLDVQPIEHDR